jgi:hypothetical protein
MEQMAGTSGASSQDLSKVASILEFLEAFYGIARPPVRAITGLPATGLGQVQVASGTWRTPTIGTSGAPLCSTPRIRRPRAGPDVCSTSRPSPSGRRSGRYAVTGPVRCAAVAST